MTNLLKSLDRFFEVIPTAMELPSYNNVGSGKRILIVQPTLSLPAFKKQANNLMTAFLNTAVADKDKIDFHEAIKTIIEVLNKLDPVAMHEVGLEVAIDEFQLEIHEQMAMKEDANLTWEMMKVIKKHLIHSGADILVPEYKMRMCRSQYIRPASMYYRDPLSKERTHLAWYIPVDRQIISWLDHLANDEMKDQLGDMKKFHCIFYADHGQGSMKVGITCLLFGEEDVLLKKRIFQVGFVDCKKDTYAVMAASIAPDIDREVAEKSMYREIANQKRGGIIRGI